MTTAEDAKARQNHAAKLALIGTFLGSLATFSLDGPPPGKIRPRVVRSTSCSWASPATELVGCSPTSAWQSRYARQ